MNTALNPFPPDATNEPFTPEPWQVAVFFADSTAKERALTLTDHLTRRFMAEVDFEFTWWSLEQLESPAIAETAALSALDADILVFAAPALSEPDPTVRAWFETWVPHRNEDFGALVPLLYPATVEALSQSVWMVEIEEIARQSCLDCLLPSELQSSPLFSQSVRHLQHQTKHLGRVLDGILHQPNCSPPTLTGE